MPCLESGFTDFSDLNETLSRQRFHDAHRQGREVSAPQLLRFARQGDQCVHRDPVVETFNAFPVDGNMSMVSPPDLEPGRHCITVPSGSLYTSGIFGPRAGSCSAPVVPWSNAARIFLSSAISLIVAEVVVVEAGFGVGVLAGEAQGKSSGSVMTAWKQGAGAAGPERRARTEEFSGVVRCVAVPSGVVCSVRRVPSQVKLVRSAWPPSSVGRHLAVRRPRGS